MHTYQVNVTREDRWWMITVPELNGYKDADGAINLTDTTQARRLSEVPGQALDFICTVTDKAPSEVGVHINIAIDGIGDVTMRADKVRKDRELAERYATAAQEEAKELARDLAAHGVAVRDVGDVLGMSHQRAQQLISA